MYKKSNSFVYKFVLRQGVPYKAENWNVLSHEQYFSKHRFLDICQSAFNYHKQEKGDFFFKLGFGCFVRGKNFTSFVFFSFQIFVVHWVFCTLLHVENNGIVPLILKIISQIVLTIFIFKSVTLKGTFMQII